VSARLQCACVAGVLTLTFDQPDRLNAITRETLIALVSHLERAQADEAVRCVLFTGAGEAFTSGQDLDELAEGLGGSGSEEPVVALARFQRVTELVLGLPKPTIAAVNGVAVGFGAELALACDVRLASTQARLGYVEATRGLFQTNGVLWLLPRVVGHGNAARLLIGGEIVDAQHALRIGLVSEILEPDDLLPKARALAERLAGNAPLSVRLVKEVLRDTWDSDLRQVMAREVDGMLTCLASEDLREGTAAFLERRTPRYTGR